jgi:glycine cleavage system H protein
MEVLSLLKVKGMKFPLDRKYYIKNGAHTWLKSECNIIKIGIDAFAAEAIGSINFFNINKKKVKSGEDIGSFESTKFVGRFYSPISGEVVAVNHEVLSNPQMISNNPYDSWIVAIKPNNKNKFKYILEEKDEISNWISKEIKKMEGDK